MFDPNERVPVSLPAHMINALMEVLQRSSNLPLPYVVLHPLIVELQVQLARAQQAQANVEEEVTTALGSATQVVRAGRANRHLDTNG